MVAKATFFLFFPELGSNLCRAGNGAVAFLFSSERRRDVARGGRRFDNVPLPCLPDRRRKERHGGGGGAPLGSSPEYRVVYGRGRSFQNESDC